jgi:hypothetical protein
VLALLAAVRLAIPLAQLAHADLPGLPRYRWHGLSGDATGFYAAVREFVAAWARVPRIGLALLAIAALAALVLLVREWRRRPGRRAWLLVLGVLGAGLVVCVDVAEQQATGAAVFGWPLVWALPLLPLRAFSVLNPTTAFGVGVALQLAFNVVTLVAVAYAGLHATGRRSVGIVAATVWAFWPFLTNVLAGHSAWGNGTWAIDAGLHMYTEPLSTALVAVALALLLRPDAGELQLAAAGCALSLATLVKLSNGLLAIVALAVLAWRHRGRLVRVLPFAAGAVTLLPVVAVYWPLSYPKLFDNRRSWPAHPFEAHYLVRNWTHSILFGPHTLAIVFPLALLGVAAVRGTPARVLLAGFTLVNAAFYSFYANTPIHPRFLWASLPSFFVLWSAGAVWLVTLLAQRRLPAPRALGSEP